MDYRLDIFRQMLLYMRRGKSKGVYINAKPIFCLALIDWSGTSQKNEIEWNNHIIFSNYESIFNSFGVTPKTPIWKPFYYLSSEPFYSLIWKTTLPDNIGKQISAKFLRENLLFAKLDDELWELLQEPSNREYLKNAIINQYLKD